MKTLLAIALMIMPMKAIAGDWMYETSEDPFEKTVSAVAWSETKIQSNVIAFSCSSDERGLKVILVTPIPYELKYSEYMASFMFAIDGEIIAIPNVNAYNLSNAQGTLIQSGYIEKMNDALLLLDGISKAKTYLAFKNGISPDVYFVDVAGASLPLANVKYCLSKQGSKL